MTGFRIKAKVPEIRRPGKTGPKRIGDEPSPVGEATTTGGGCARWWPLGMVLVLIKTSQGWMTVKFKVRGLINNGWESREEKDILRAVFRIQTRYGSLLSDPGNPAKAGYASGGVMCRGAEWKNTSTNRDRAGRALRRAERKGFCSVFKIAEDGKLDGANRIILSYRCFRLTPYVSESAGLSGPLNLIWLSSSSSFDLPDDQVEDHDASKAAWSQGLSAFRDRGKVGVPG